MSSYLSFHLRLLDPYQLQVLIEFMTSSLDVSRKLRSLVIHEKCCIAL